MDERTIAQQIFDGFSAQSALADQLYEAGVEFERLGFDSYDNSLEIKGTAPSVRLSEAAQRAIHAAGFTKVYMNHTDEWETHYRFDPIFVLSEGWRVSYRNKFGGKNIWVEKHVPSWPEEWFDSGYVVVKSPDSASTNEVPK